MDITIVQATETDMRNLVEIWKEFMDYHKGIDPFFTRGDQGHVTFANYLAELIGNPGSLVLAAMHGAEHVGYTIAKIDRHPPVLLHQAFGHITDMAVKPAFRRHGAGEKMLEQTFGWFRDKKIKRVELHVVPDNSIGFSFWRKMGFETYMHAMFKEV